jgi:hypothetical protein
MEVDMAEVQRLKTQGMLVHVEIEVPKLTKLVEFTSDPDLRPFTVIKRVYPYPIDQDRVKLPAIS